MERRAFWEGVQINGRANKQVILYFEFPRSHRFGRFSLPNLNKGGNVLFVAAGREYMRSVKVLGLGIGYNCLLDSRYADLVSPSLCVMWGWLTRN